MNKDEFKQLITKLKNDKKAIVLILVALSGMLLIMFSETGNKDAENYIDNPQNSLSEKQLAGEVESFIENIKGAGKTRVILTFEALEETVYAVDKDEATSDGRHNVKDKYVIIDSGNKEDGLKLKIVSPRVRGVAVVCRGGDNPLIKEQIVSAISALFDISSNKISVAVMAD